MAADLCPFCGAYSTRSCELEEELAGAECPWEALIADEPDPDFWCADSQDRGATPPDTSET